MKWKKRITHKKKERQQQKSKTTHKIKKNYTNNGYKMKIPNNLVKYPINIVEQACENMNLPDYQDLKFEMNRAK